MGCVGSLQLILSLVLLARWRFGDRRIRLVLRVHRQHIVLERIPERLEILRCLEMQPA